MVTRFTDTKKCQNRSSFILTHCAVFIDVFLLSICSIRNLLCLCKVSNTRKQIINCQNPYLSFHHKLKIKNFTQPQTRTCSFSSMIYKYNDYSNPILLGLKLKAIIMLCLRSSSCSLIISCKNSQVQNMFSNYLHIKNRRQ